MRRVVEVALLVLLLPAGVRAQVVRGTMVDAGTGQPLYGSIVVLLDSAGTQVTGAISDEQGHFTIAAPGPGRYTLRANRIGFQSTTSASFTLTAGQSLDRRLAASAIPIQLSAIEVTGKERCTTRPEEGRAAFLVWNEVRKALTATALTVQQKLLRVHVRHFERDVDPGNGRVRSEQSTEQTGVSAQPFVALPAELLERNGYAQVADSVSMYYAPDATVLLSDVFTAHHCFRVEQDRHDARTLLGLAFEPVRDRDVPDVKGVLWVDRVTSELRTLEFTYTGLPRAIPRDRFGGEIAFRRLPTGAWIIERWILHLPVMATVIRRSSTALGEIGPVHREAELAAVHETGGEVLSASTRDGVPLTLSETASLQGVVYDSTRGAPLSGALVALAGTADSTRTDSTGGFRMEGLGAGTYTVAVSHPRLDSLAIGALAHNATLRRGIVSTVRLAVPPYSSIVARFCPDSLRQPDMAFVAGTVRDAATRRPVPGASVAVTWTFWSVGRGLVLGRGHGVATTSDSLGHYHACGVQSDARLTVTAQRGEQRGEVVIETLLPDGGTAFRDVYLTAEPSG